MEGKIDLFKLRPFNVCLFKFLGIVYLMFVSLVPKSLAKLA